MGCPHNAFLIENAGKFITGITCNDAHQKIPWGEDESSSNMGKSAKSGDFDQVTCQVETAAKPSTHKYIWPFSRTDEHVMTFILCGGEIENSVLVIHAKTHTTH